MKSVGFVSRLALWWLCASVACAQVKQLDQPDFYKTLVNPPCSHCIDEAKRRAEELRADDRVLAWIRGKYDGGAVPFRFFLVPYRVISDSYGVWVYDADAGFVRGFEPSFDFSFHGWRNGIMVIQHKDGTLYSALSGVAFGGPRKGDVLKALPTIETDWGYWLKAYPGTVAYHMFDKYVARELPETPTAESVSTQPPPDPRLKPDEPVIGIAMGEIARAYPISLLASNPIIRDKIGDQEIVVLWYAPTKTAAIYAPRLENETTPQRLQLRHDAQIPTAPFMDHETFSHWTIEGRAVEGPLKGKVLAWLPGVRCKWSAWSAEYPKTEIYSSAAKHTARSEPPIAKLVEGERLDWDKLVKTTGYVVKLNDASVTVFTDHDQKEHQLVWTPQSEFHVDGAWGSSADFQTNQDIFLIATKNGKGELVNVHALVDDLSLQAMSRPFVLKQHDQSTGQLVFVDQKGRKAPMNLKVGPQTRFFTSDGAVLKTGSNYYCNIFHTDTGLVAAEVYDAGGLDARRTQRVARQLAQLQKTGLTATVLERDRVRNQLSVIVPRSDAWFARFLKVGDQIEFQHEGGGRLTASVNEVMPDYSRERVRLEWAGTGMAGVKPGDTLSLFIRLPGKIDFDTVPDLGRFTGRQERIDYFLATIYCPCGMIGTSCAGHWNTLAACQLHGCGMPDVFTKLIGGQIDAGQNDEAILSGLVNQYGRHVLRAHQN